MKLILALILATLQGCAAYTVTSLATYTATDKTLTDHITSKATNANCNTSKLIHNKQDYYCEVRDESTTYNRSPF